MNMLRSIITNRWYHRWPTWLMVHEWEDVLSEKLQIPIVDGDQNSFFKSSNFEGPYDLLFMQVASEIMDYYMFPHLIPVVMDVWGTEIEDFSKYVKEFKLFFVTCLEAFNTLKKMGLGNVAYLPYSVPDKYILDAVPCKDIDIIQFGRTNPVLDKYMERFLEKFPDTNYVRTLHRDNRLYFHSTRDGILGESDSREKFMSLLFRSTISLVSTAGMDGSRDTGGYNPVSPRFFESIAGFCRLIGRFPESEEFTAFGIDDIANRVNCYEEFENIVIHYLCKPFDRFDQYRSFLTLHTTSRRVPLIVNALASVHGLRSNLHTSTV